LRVTRVRVKDSRGSFTRSETLVMISHCFWRRRKRRFHMDSCDGAHLFALLWASSV